jgi:alpha-L-fucosidase
MRPFFPSIKLAALIVGCLSAATFSSPGQEIKLAKPTSAQLAFQDLELGAFIHYSIDVYEKPGSPPGGTPASDFNPTELNVEQWVLAAKAMGATYVVLTARHEEGFCLWPTKTTDYSIKSSPYRGGKGDIVREFVDACRKHGLKPGLYNPPWIDRHWDAGFPDYKRTDDPARIDKLDDPVRYAQALKKETEQLRELMSNYGPLVFIWDDHNGRSDSIGPIPRGGKCRDLYASLAKTAHELQPDCLYFGPDVEHVGNEEGRACDPLWNAVTTLDGTDYTISTTYKWNGTNVGDPLGRFYRPRLGPTTTGFSTGGWMWTRPRRPQPLERRLQVYYETIGRGAGILVNLTPDRRGLVPGDLVAAAREMGDEIKRRFSHPLAQTSGAGSVHVLKFPVPQTFDHVITMEDLREGQKIVGYTIAAEIDGGWKTIIKGQTIGHKRIDQFAPVTATAVRFTCTQSLAEPVGVRRLAIYSTESKIP